MTRKLITNPQPLQPGYLPSKLLAREDEQTTLTDLLDDSSTRNIHVQGPRGTGKTHLLQKVLRQLPSDTTTCLIDCRHHQTQYQALKQIYQTLTQEPVKDGYHTSTLQRKIKERTGATQNVIVLDELDFLLQNDANDLLYYLSRLNKPINIVTVASQNPQLQKQLEERTYSTLQPYTVQIPHYTGETVYEILLRRARKALKPQSLQREALTYISSQVQNVKTGLHWLKNAAQQTSTDVITESTVREAKTDAHHLHAKHLLKPFTPHHRLTHQAIKELHTEQDEEDAVNAGDVYQRYQELTETYDLESLTSRRISTFLKHLELLEIIEAQYHYGGRKGKTREITLNYPL